MTVRPRYTARMKARDLAVGYSTLGKASAPILRAAAVVLGTLTASLLRGTLRTLTTRYTDPRSPR